MNINMRAKSFLLFSISIFGISLFLIIFHSQPPQSIQSIVSQTHRHIKDFQENLRDVEESNLVEDERYLQSLGLGQEPIEVWHNTTTPVLVSCAREATHAQAVLWLRAAARLPYTVLLYNLGLQPASRAIVASHCNSSKCAIIDFDLSAFPYHVGDESIHAYRPLIIQHALSRTRGVVWADSWRAWAGSARALAALWARARRCSLVAWPRRAAVTSLTHPRMFSYLAARADDFLFVPMLDASRLLLADTPPARRLMRPWVRCALTLDCIMPIGAQSDGCRFDKKPQYRYSGCHGQDASALSILAQDISGARAAPAAPGLWRRVPAAAPPAARDPAPAPPAARDPAPAPLAARDPAPRDPAPAPPATRPAAH